MAKPDRLWILQPAFQEAAVPPEKHDSGALSSGKAHHTAHHTIYDHGSGAAGSARARQLFVPQGRNPAFTAIGDGEEGFGDPRMTPFDRGSHETSSSLREATTLFALLTIIAGVGAAWGLDQLTSDGGRPKVAVLRVHRLQARMADLPLTVNQSTDRENETTLSQTTLDYTPVGSIPANLAKPVTLDPCNGTRK